MSHSPPISPGAASPNGADDARPQEAGAEARPELDAYARGWAAINKLIRRGLSWSGHERNCAFLNLGDGSFAGVSSVTGFDFADDARALSLTDWDGDGDTDLLLTNRNTPRVRYLENRLGRGRGTVLALAGTSANTDAIGARVELFPRAESAGEAAPLVRAVRAGEGYLAQSSARLHFGLAGKDVARVVVHWPAGEAETFTGVSAGGTFLLRQGEGRATPFAPTWEARNEPLEPAPVAEASGEGAAHALPSRTARRIVLATPVPLPALELIPPGGEAMSLFGVRPGGAGGEGGVAGTGTGTGKDLLLHLWGSWCAPCVEELADHAARASELDASGLAFLALSADAAEGEGAAAARGIVERVDWPYAWAFASQDALERLDALFGVVLDTEERMPLPTSFLVDASGLLRAIYVGPVDLDRLLADRVLLGATDEVQLRHAMPFPGRWRRRPVFDADTFRKGLARRGLSEAEAEYERAGYRVVQRSRSEILHELGRERAAAGDLAGAAQVLRRAVEEDPSRFAPRYELGQALHRLEDLHEAISAYRGALELRPDHADLRFNLALAYLGTQQVRSAQGELEELERLASPLAAELRPHVEALRRRLEER